MAATWNLSYFSTELLTVLKLPTSSNNINALNAWQLKEGGTGIGSGQGTPTAYNPLNTIQGGFGGVPTPGYSAGIMSYPNFGSGVLATATALKNGLYGPILSSLKASAPPSQTAAAINASQWGTSGLTVTSTPPSIVPLQGGNIPATGFPQTGFSKVPIGAAFPPGGFTNIASGVGSGIAGIPGDVTNAVLSPFEAEVRKIATDVGLVLLGITLLILGLWLMFRDSGHSGSSGSALPPAPKSARTTDAKAAEVAAA